MSQCHTLMQSNRRILVVDDNRAIHADFKKILCPAPDHSASLEAAEAEIFGQAPAVVNAAGFQVDSAYQGQEGFALVQEALAAGEPYSLIFMDVRMPPGWDGVETTAHVWGIAPDTQIVICTAYSDYSWDELITRLGICDRLVILKKPFDNLEVVQLAHALTEKWRLRQEARLKMGELEAMVAARTRELQAANEQLKVEMAERERTEEALRQSQKMEALGKLAGGIAHDFNNLLTVIRGYVDCLLDERHSDDTLDALREIGQATDRAAKLTSQILMFSRKKRMQPQNLDLNQVVQRLGNMLRRLLGETITMVFRPGPGPLMVHADPVMMEQVLLNLAMNGRDAMPNGGTLTVEAGEAVFDETGAKANPQARPGRFARVSVADTGSGIPTAVLPHLFDPFFTTKEPGKGTGLGLATVYGVVQQHQGWIDVENRAGEGAKFIFFIPLSPIPAATSPDEQPRAKLVGGKETILLVEDEPVVHRLARNILQRLGYRVYEASNGAEALTVWGEHAEKIDLLLTDMVMPGDPGGRKLARTLQAQKPTLKVIYTTGYSVDALNMDEPLDEGSNFVPKPYTSESLARVLRRQLDEPSSKNDLVGIETGRPV
jgi:two-component system NtrC family sensor kinase